VPWHLVCIKPRHPKPPERLVSRHPSQRYGSIIFVAMLATLAVIAGCGRLHRGGPGDVPPAMLLFTNESLDQADVYASVSGGENTRIGTVLAGRTDTLVVPPTLIGHGSIRVIARLLARSATPGTGPFTLSPGDQYQVRLPPDEKMLVLLPAK
jgi:predicted small lipoprotein YifL